MPRRFLLALLFCVAAWVTLAQMMPPADNINAAAAGISSEITTEAPGNTGDSNNRWEAGSRVNVSITESLWKSSVVHADLAGARSGDVFVETHDTGRRDRPTRNGPALLRIPLLI